MNIIAESSVPYLRGVIEELGAVTYLKSSEFTPAAVRDADWLIVRSITRCTPDLLRGSRVSLITTATIGFDHIDTFFCEQNGISWYNAPGCNAESVGQYFGSLLALYAADRAKSLDRLTLGIVGVGHVGTVVQRYAQALGMRTLLHDPPRAEEEESDAFVDLGTIADECDIITYHTPLVRTGTHPTYHLLDHDFVRQLRRRPLIVNACRGSVTSGAALLWGLQEGYISDVALDCWEGEPEVDRELLRRVWLATPHIAGFSADGKANGARACVLHGMKHFGLHTDRVYTMIPPPPSDPLIRYASLSEPKCLSALLHTYTPRTVEALLRGAPERFEELRRSYSYPREPHAYTVVGDLSVADRQALSTIGFGVSGG